MPDIRFGPNLSGNFYISVYYHQATAKQNPHKSRWIIPPNEEYDLFNLADERVKDGEDESPRKWESGGYLYSFRNKMKDVIGRNGERVGKFDPGSVIHEWHGYPKIKPDIDKSLNKEWFEEGLISAATKQKLIFTLYF